MLYKATAKYLLISPTKVRPVADLIRGKNYEDAQGILLSLPQKGAQLILKVLESAGANAMHRNSKLDESQLKVSSIYVDGGPVMKRVWPRSHGKRDILLKRTSHITVMVSEMTEV